MTAHVPTVTRVAGSPGVRGFLDSADYWTLLDTREDGGAALYYIDVYEGMEPEAHDRFDQLFIVESGSGAFGVEGIEQPVGPGDAVWIPRGTTHYPRPDTGGLRYWCLSFAEHGSDDNTPAINRTDSFVLSDVRVDPSSDEEDER